MITIQLQQRIITAAILIPVVIGGVLALPQLEFAIVSALVLLLAGWEWAGLIGLKYNENLLSSIKASGSQRRWLKFFTAWWQGRLFYLVLLTLLFIFTSFINPKWILILAGIWWLVGALLYMVAYSFNKISSAAFTLFFKATIGLLILVACWHGLIVIRTVGPFYLLFVLIMVWIIDSAAYFVGKAWGKHKLASSISPNKTVEGALGGISAALIFALLVSGTGSHFLIGHHGYGSLTLLTLLTAVTSIIGDLFESMMKRLAGVKDSGHLLRGHGGVLDRIDSLIAVTPIFALGLSIIL